MSSTRVKENIVLLLENIVKRSQDIEKQTGNNSLLSIDLAMEDLRLLYRQMEKLRTLTSMEIASNLTENSDRIVETITSFRADQSDERPVHSEKSSDAQKHNTEPERTKPDESNIPPAPDLKPKSPAADVTAKIPAPEKEVQEEKVSESQAAEDPVKEPARATISKVSYQEKEVERKSEQPAARNDSSDDKSNLPLTIHAAENTQTLVGEKFTPSKNSVHERLAQIKEDKSIGARLQQKPVKNIKDAIGLNEKFLFINELFNGDLEAYNRSVNELNGCPGIHEAFGMLNQLTSDFNWDGQRSAETIDKFANIVQRRYI